MEFSDEQFARLIAGFDHPSVSGPNIPHYTSESSSASSRPILIATRAPAASTTSAAAYSPGMMFGAQHMDVDASDPEYTKIKQDLDSAGLTMCRLVKLSNPVLEEKFDGESAHLMKIKQHMEGFALNIQSLYHGTTAPFDQICDEGLDERLSRPGRFGRGIYFSDNPKKCCKYAEHRTSKPYLLRCKVILGDIKEYPPNEQDKTLTKEPVKMVKHGKRVYYDSVKGRPNDYNEYVIYEKRRALIEYIAFYEPVKSAKPAKAKSKATSAAVVTHIASSSSMSSHTASETSDADMGAVGGHFRCNTPDLEDGSGSLGSGRSTPDDSDGSVGHGDDDDYQVTPSLPVYSDTFLVPHVQAVRKRNRVPATDANTLHQNAATTATTLAAGTTPAATTSGTGVTHAPVLAVISDEMRQSPQLAALRYLLDMKGKLPPAQLEYLTREYHRTYGAEGCLAGGPSLLPIDDPVSEVMKKLIQEFKDITQCTDTVLCQRYIELGNMDLNRAVEAYIDSTS